MLKDDPHFISFSPGEGEVYPVSLFSGKLKDSFFLAHASQQGPRGDAAIGFKE